MIKRYAGLHCNDAEVRIKSLTITFSKNIIPFYSQFERNNDIYKCLTSDMKEIKAFEEAEKREKSRQSKEQKQIATA